MTAGTSRKSKSADAVGTIDEKMEISTVPAEFPLDDFISLFRELRIVQEQARALGLFVNDRELLECKRCSLLEDEAFDGRLITYLSGDATCTDTGLRFKELKNNRFRCPQCKAIVVPPPEADPPEWL